MQRRGTDARATWKRRRRRRRNETWLLRLEESLRGNCVKVGRDAAVKETDGLGGDKAGA